MSIVLGISLGCVVSFVTGVVVTKKFWCNK